MPYPLTPRVDRLRRLYAARRRIEAEIAVLLANEPQPIPPRRLPECGTDVGYQHHVRHGEDSCGPCKVAHAARERLYYARRKQLSEAS